MISLTTPRRSRSALPPWTAILLVFFLVAAACSSSDDATTTTAAAAATTEGTTATTEAEPEPDIRTQFPADVQPLLTDMPDNLVAAFLNVRNQGPGELVWVDAGGELHDGWRAAFLDNWEAITGWTVIPSSPGIGISAAVLQTQVESGNPEWDIFTLTDYASYRNQAAMGFWEIVDYTLFPMEAMGDTAFILDDDGNVVDPADATSVSSGLGVGASDFGIVLNFNTDAYPASGAQPSTILDIFNTGEFPGKRCLFNWAQFGGNLEIAAMAEGVTWDDVPTVLADPAGRQAAFDKLDTIYDDIVFTNSGAESVQFVIDRQCDLGVTFSGRPALRVREEPSLPLALTWNDGMVTGGPWGILKGAPHFDAAESLVAYGMQPIIQCAQLNEIGYGVPLNSPVFPDCLTEFGATWGVQYEDSLFTDGAVFVENPEIETEWAEWQAGH